MRKFFNEIVEIHKDEIITPLVNIKLTQMTMTPRLAVLPWNYLGFRGIVLSGILGKD